MDDNKTYTVANIIGEYPAQFEKTRVVFTTNETGETQLSGFFKFKPQVGKTVFGKVTVNEKDGKTYHNFTPAPNPNAGRGGSGNNNAVLAKLEVMHRDLRAVLTHLKVKTNEPEEGKVYAPAFTPPGGYPEGPTQPASFDTSEAEAISFDGDPATDPEWDPFAGMGAK